MNTARLSFPHLPRRTPLLPKAFQQSLVAQRVHTLPKAVVSKRRELSVSREPLQRVRFEAVVVTFEVIEQLRLENEEAPVYPSPICGFSVKSFTRSPSNTRPPKRAGGRTAVTVAIRPCDL